MAKSGKTSVRKPTPAKSGKQSKAKVISKKATPAKKASPAKKSSKTSPKVKWVAPFEKKISMYKTQGDYFAKNVKYAGM